MNASAVPEPAVLPVLDRTTLWTTAIREGFILLLPLTMLGAIALTLAELAAMGADGPGASWTLAGHELAQFCRRTYAATMGIMGIAAAVTISIRACTLLCEHHRLQTPPPAAGIAALAAAAFVWGAAGSGAGPATLGYGHIMLGIFCGLVSAEIGCAVYRRLPGAAGLAGLQARSVSGQALRLCWVAVAVLGAVAALSLLASQVGAPLWAWAWQQVAAGVERLQPGPVVLNVVMTVVNQLAWLLGINGGQALLEMNDHGVLLAIDKRALWSDQVATPMLMNVFGHLGGAGATWGLILAVLWKARDGGIRRLAQVSIVPAVLNVNEMLLFGLPLVFNRLMWLPFLLAPVLNVLIAASLFALGVLSPDGRPVAWSTPILLSGAAMTQSAAGACLQLALVLLDMLIYLPFLRRLEQVRTARGDLEFRSVLDVLMQPPGPGTRVLDRADGVGDVARRLMEDFAADLRADRVELAYQPKHGRDGSVAGIEALTRWRHPHYGAIPIAAVVNVAEECEVVHALGRWVVACACRDLAVLHAAGHAHLQVGINMSPLQLESADWPDDVAAALAAHGLRPGALDVEITEGRMLSTTAQSDETLERLQALGVALSMDDFGMGCTSLLYMQRFRMQSIKLDGALTRDILANRVNQDIVAAVVRLGHAQGVQVVAEFVETAEQRELLCALGCDAFQGWHYSKALGLDELQDYLRRCEDRQTALLQA